MSIPKNAYVDPLGLNTDLEPTGSDETKEIFEAQIREQFELNMAIAQTFNTPHGKKVLAFLRKATIESAAWMPSLAMQHGIEAANAHAYAREGQNAMVRDVESRIELAQKCKSPDDLFDLMRGVAQ